jgi:hypothetical protein
MNFGCWSVLSFSFFLIPFHVQVLALLTYNLIFDGLTEVSRGHWVIHFFTDMQQKNLRNGEVR